MTNVQFDESAMMKSRESNGHSIVEMELETDDQSDSGTSLDYYDRSLDKPNVQDFQKEEDDTGKQ